ncbi:hypothetical protein Patl1_25037 [Pistacia atlantica]|uniref:Uncharacterized protein n=1 Tax=Pistacia atlantica TaxID=434234 RepID=A0ACC1B4U0_9ROSI|nr:hypothetical protein Patl1_25037 [Pistacia atlantica]
MALKSSLFVSHFVAVALDPMAEAQLGIIGGLLNLIHIQGTVYCTANGNIGVNGTATPVFQTNCSLEVNTPLARCDAKLPEVGTLLSPLLSIGNTLLGFLNIANLVPAGFQFVP